MYGFPPGTTSVTFTVERSGGTTSRETLTDEPIAADGSWGLTTSSASGGVNTVTVTAGGVSRSATFTTTAPTFSVQITQSTNGAIVARTKAGALCVAWAFLPNNTYSQAPELYVVKAADAGGAVRWDYPPDSGSGTGTQVVRCVIDDETHQASRQYSLP
jgi:hypothetical protein